VDVSSIAGRPESLTSLDDEAQLRDLQALLDSLSPSSITPDVYRALFRVFERFPEHDGFGVCWTIVHLLEKCSGYEQYLLESVNRNAAEFNLTMVNRLINGGFEKIGPTSLTLVLTDVANNEGASASARAQATRFLEYQRARSA
jgi:hypothetical protein